MRSIMHRESWIMYLPRASHAVGLNPLRGKARVPRRLIRPGSNIQRSYLDLLQPQISPSWKKERSKESCFFDVVNRHSVYAMAYFFGTVYGERNNGQERKKHYSESLKTVKYQRKKRRGRSREKSVLGLPQSVHSSSSPSDPFTCIISCSPDGVATDLHISTILPGAGVLYASFKYHSFAYPNYKPSNESSQRSYRSL